MSVTAGALSLVLGGQTTASVSSAAATSGTGPCTYQWYRSTTTGFTPASGNLISGATALALVDSGLAANTQYYYKVIATDTGAGNATSTATQLGVLTQPSLSQNQFAQQNLVGVVDLKVGPGNVIAAQVDVSLPAGILVMAGQLVKLVANTAGGIPKIIPITSKSDVVFGAVTFNVKDLSYGVGQNLEVALWGTVLWMFATGAITQGAVVCADPTYVGGVQATGNSATFVGQALDGAAAASLIRVMLVPNAAGTTA